MIALQVVGSPTSQFYFDLSLVYGREVVRPPGFDLLFLTAYPTGEWSLGAYPDAETEKFGLGQLVDRLPDVNLVVPHLFCPRGLTVYRSFFEEILGLPLVGSPGSTLRVAQQKQLTKMVARAAGVRVPKGHLLDLSASDKPAEELSYPLIVKPNASDNSDGLSLIFAQGELFAALEKAKPYGTQILLEEYVPGREIRGALIELDGTLRVLPFIEYGVSAAHPIRLAADKLKTDSGGRVVGQSAKEQVPAHCPADLSGKLSRELGAAMKKTHRALGCRDFSLFDFRVHAATGEAYLLEAGLFWSFGPPSMISGMLAAQGDDLEEITAKIWQAAAGR